MCSTGWSTRPAGGIGHDGLLNRFERHVYVFLGRFTRAAAPSGKRPIDLAAAPDGVDATVDLAAKSARTSPLAKASHSKLATRGHSGMSSMVLVLRPRHRTSAIRSI
jgi:hypothetical protein